MGVYATVHFDENAPDASSEHVSPGSNVPAPLVVKVTDPVGGTRDATGPVSVTVAMHEAGVPGDVPFGVQLIDSVDGFAASAEATRTSASVDTIAPTSRRDPPLFQSPRDRLMRGMVGVAPNRALTAFALKQKPPIYGGFRADDGTRTHDLLHGKQTL